MMMMSKAIFDLTCKNIDVGFQNKDSKVIEKETDYILSKIVTIMLSYFSDKICGVSLNQNAIVFREEYLLTEKHRKDLIKWLQRLANMSFPASDIEFGKLKVDLESWFYQLGGEEIRFHYRQDYLLTPKEAAEYLGISKVTLNKYIQQGFECVETSSHRKIPKFVVELWKDPVYAIRMQMIAQEKKLRNQTPQERLSEINQELSKLEWKYKTSSFQEAFRGYDGDSMDDPTDYYLWRDLENEKKEILKLLGGS
jgi:excisionase family DNA binding protein